MGQKMGGKGKRADSLLVSSPAAPLEEFFSLLPQPAAAGTSSSSLSQKPTKAAPISSSFPEQPHSSPHFLANNTEPFPFDFLLPQPLDASLPFPFISAFPHYLLGCSHSSLHPTPFSFTKNRASRFCSSLHTISFLLSTQQLPNTISFLSSRQQGTAPSLQQQPQQLPVTETKPAVPTDFSFFFSISDRTRSSLQSASSNSGQSNSHNSAAITGDPVASDSVYSLTVDLNDGPATTSLSPCSAVALCTLQYRLIRHPKQRRRGRNPYQTDPPETKKKAKPRKKQI